MSSRSGCSLLGLLQPEGPRQGEQGLGSASTIPGPLTALALLLSFKPAHRTGSTDISLSEFNYGSA